MNAERLHALVLAICDDLKATDSLNRLNQLTQALSQAVNQPQAPQHQQHVSKWWTALSESLENAPSNDFSPSWHQLLEEIGAEALLGSKLRDRIEGILQRHQITLSIASDEIQDIHRQLEAMNDAVTKLLQGFDHFEIGAEQLDPGECELGVLVPRVRIENKLNEFGNELVTLHKIFGVFEELATGSRPGFDIRSISSTDLLVFLHLTPETAMLIALAVERIFLHYKNLLEIRQLRKKLSEKNVPDKKLQGIDDYAQDFMTSKIKAIVKEVMEEATLPRAKERQNELATELTLALNQIANRIDRGFNIEIRAEPLEEGPSDEEEDEEEATRRKAIDHVLASSKNLQFLNADGDPILRLPEPKEEDGE